MATKRTDETYYLVKVRLKEVKAYNGNVLTREDEERYLGDSEGYYQIGARPKRFTTPPTRDEVAKWDQAPWYCVIKSAEVIKVTEKMVHTRTEESLGEPASN